MHQHTDKNGYTDKQTWRKHLLYTSMFLLVGSIFFGYTQEVWADSVSRYDCGIVKNGIPEGVIHALGASPLYDTAALTLAFQHLLDFCCNEGYIKNTPKTPITQQVCKEDLDRPKGAESPYIFDHLINIGFRKIDASPDPGLRYNLTPDPKGQERQGKRLSFIDAQTHTTPETIIDTYNSTDFWQISYQPFALTDACGGNTEQYNRLSLPEKYEAACTMAVCISKKTGVAGANSLDSSASKSDTINCKQKALTRKDNETALVKQFLTRIGIRTITNTVNQYTQNYFLGTRRQNLYEHIMKMDQGLIFVNRKIQEGTPVCSQ